METDPPGTYFSTNDFVGAGGSRVFLGFGDFSDLGTSFGPLAAPAPFGPINVDLVNFPLGPLPQQPLFDPTFLGVPRGPDDDGSDSGQFGLAMRFFSEQLQGTEFGLYYLKYNSRLPIISARTGTAAGVGLALASASAVATGGATIAALTAAGSPDPVGQAGQKIGRAHV